MKTKLAQIRPGRPGDAAQLANVYAEAWHLAYQGIIPHVPLQRMIARRGPNWWTTTLIRSNALLVLDFGGSAMGYATFGRNRIGPTPQQGEIFELYLHPVYQGLGFGRLLFGEARKRLANRQLKGLVTWALADNEGACAFYSSIGGKAIAETTEHFGEVNLSKVAFAWR